MVNHPDYNKYTYLKEPTSDEMQAVEHQVREFLTALIQKTGVRMLIDTNPDELMVRILTAKQTVQTVGSLGENPAMAGDKPTCPYCLTGSPHPEGAGITAINAHSPEGKAVIRALQEAGLIPHKDEQPLDPKKMN